MTTTLQRRRLLQGAAAALLPLQAQVPVQAAAAPRFAVGPHDFLLDGKPCRSAAARCTSPACRASTGATA
jgi:hypothetical protein